MKTPKRTYVTNFLEWGDEFHGRLSSGQKHAYARWKRKNKIAQLKRTIARQKAKICALEFKCEEHQHNMLIVQHTLKRQLESMNKAYFSHANVLNNLIDLKKL